MVVNGTSVSVKVLSPDHPNNSADHVRSLIRKYLQTGSVNDRCATGPVSQCSLLKSLGNINYTSYIRFMRSQGARKGVRNETYRAAIKFFHHKERTKQICSSRISSENQRSDSARMEKLGCENLSYLIKNPHESMQSTQIGMRGRLSLILLRKRKQKRDQYLAKRLKEF